MNSFSGTIRFLRFGAVGLSGVVVNAGLLWMLTELAHLDYRLSSIVAIECAIINNFFWNLVWTWQERRTASLSRVLVMFFKFNVSSGVTAFAVNWGLLVLLTEIVGLQYQISNLIGIACGTGVNFFVSNFWTFRTVKQ